MPLSGVAGVVRLNAMMILEAGLRAAAEGTGRCFNTWTEFRGLASKRFPCPLARTDQG